MNEAELELIKQIAKLPPMTISGTPLFFLILAMSLPEILKGEDLGEWGPWLQEEAGKMIEEIEQKLPPESRKLLAH